MNYRMTVLGMSVVGIVALTTVRSIASAPVRAQHVTAFQVNDDPAKADEEKEEDKKETKVELDKLPDAVKSTVKKELPDGTITEAVIKEKKGKKYYEIVVKSGDIAYEIKTTEDGTFKSKKVDEEENEKK